MSPHTQQLAINVRSAAVEMLRVQAPDFTANPADRATLIANASLAYVNARAALDAAINVDEER